MGKMSKGVYQLLYPEGDTAMIFVVRQQYLIRPRRNYPLKTNSFSSDSQLLY